MKNVVSTLIIGVCASCLFFAAFSIPAATGSMAQQSVGDDKSEKTKIAVVDLNLVLNKSKSLQQSLGALKLKVSEGEEVGKKKVAEIQQLTQRLMGLEKGSEEYKDLEFRLQRKTKEFEEFRQDGIRKFNKEESEAYLRAYRIAAREIANYAQAHKIDLVTRFHRNNFEDNNPATVLPTLNGMQVLYENNLDITDEIISAMSEQ
ncbi:MAG: OmpH family outer membrane protein [Schlesneria sp.]